MENSSNDGEQHCDDSESVLQLTELELENSLESKGLSFKTNPDLLVEGLVDTPSEYESMTFEDAIAIQEVIGATHSYLDSESKEYFYEE